MRDYNDKSFARDAGGERRQQVARNKPRKESGGLFVLVTLLAVVLSFGAGLGTGWFLFKGSQKAPVTVAAPAPKKEEPAAAAPAQPKAEPSLTFYKTLPAGGKAAMGTGLNLKKPETPPPASREVVPPAPVPAPQASEPAAASAQAAPPATAAPVQAPGGSSKAEVYYLVQIASYREKQEATAAQAKLNAKGMAAYLVESRLPDKGVWYRLRVGKHLTKGEANELASKAGKGALVIPE